MTQIQKLTYKGVKLKDNILKNLEKGEFQQRNENLKNQKEGGKKRAPKSCMTGISLTVQ